MKLQVLHEDGSVETLELGGQLKIVEGEYLNRIVCANGFTHFFTHEGEYDGWGAGVSETPARSRNMIDALEEKRQIKD